MKHIIFTALALLSISSAWGEVSDLKLGYSGDNLPASGTISWAEADSDVSAAIRLAGGTVSTYAGNYISGVTAGLASKLNIESLTVWVRSDLAGPNLAEQTITTDTDVKIAKGWNTVEFDTPWEIPAASEGIYVGYTYHQKGAAFGVAALPEANPDAMFVRFGDGEWEDRSAEMTLCVQALVRGDKLPKVNLALTDVTVPENFVLRNGTLEIGGVVKNLATLTVSGFDVAVYSQEGERLASAPVEAQLPYGESTDFNVTVTIEADAVAGESLPLTIRIENIPEGEDEDVSDNSRDVTLGVVGRDFTRRILVEEFTTEKCPNCPRVGTYLHDALEKSEFEENVIAICHHSGYYTDWLTIPSDNELLWLYNAGGSTYAPALMVDRTPQGDETTAVFNPTSQAEMENVFTRMLKAPAYVSVDIEAEAVDAYTVRVSVDGECSVDDLCDDPRITVYLVEDDIAARSQAGASAWTHQHVGRAVNAAWGEPLTFADGAYSYTCDLTFNTTCNVENMSVVAFVSGYNRYNALDCPVFNANRIAMPDMSAFEGVDSVVSDEDAPAEYYTLQGVRVTSPGEGIYVCRRGSKASLVMLK